NHRFPSRDAHQVYDNHPRFPLVSAVIEDVCLRMRESAGGTREGSGGPGAVIGPYKLIEQIGEGGMGTVWMARQTEPVKRLVAVKLIKPGMDSRQVLTRFEAERQALALMDHPNIAKVLDAGAVGASVEPSGRREPPDTRRPDGS